MFYAIRKCSEWRWQNNNRMRWEETKIKTTITTCILNLKVISGLSIHNKCLKFYFVNVCNWLCFWNDEKTTMILFFCLLALCDSDGGFLLTQCIYSYFLLSNKKSVHYQIYVLVVCIKLAIQYPRHSFLYGPYVHVVLDRHAYCKLAFFRISKSTCEITFKLKWFQNEILSRLAKKETYKATDFNRKSSTRNGCCWFFLSICIWNISVLLSNIQFMYTWTMHETI